MRYFIQGFLVSILCVAIGFSAGWLTGVNHERNECHVQIPLSCEANQ